MGVEKSCVRLFLNLNKFRYMPFAGELCRLYEFILTVRIRFIRTIRRQMALSPNDTRHRLRSIRFDSQRKKERYSFVFRTI